MDLWRHVVVSVHARLFYLMVPQVRTSRKDALLSRREDPGGKKKQSVLLLASPIPSYRRKEKHQEEEKKLLQGFLLLWQSTFWSLWRISAPSPPKKNRQKVVVLCWVFLGSLFIFASAARRTFHTKGKEKWQIVQEGTKKA